MHRDQFTAATPDRIRNAVDVIVIQPDDRELDRVFGRVLLRGARCHLVCYLARSLEGKRLSGNRPMIPTDPAAFRRERRLTLSFAMPVV